MTQDPELEKEEYGQVKRRYMQDILLGVHVLVAIWWTWFPDDAKDGNLYIGCGHRKFDHVKVSKRQVGKLGGSLRGTMVRGGSEWGKH